VESLALVMKLRTILSHWMKRFFSILHVEATVLLIGVALLVLPGPAFIVIPVGLAILATEYAWARRWLKRARRIAGNVVSGRDRATVRDTRV